MEENKIVNMSGSDRYNSFKEMKTFFDSEILHIFNVKLNITNEELMGIHNIIYDYYKLQNKNPNIFIKEYLVGVLTSSLRNNTISIESFIVASTHIEVPNEILEKIRKIEKVR